MILWGSCWEQCLQYRDKYEVTGHTGYISHLFSCVGWGCVISKANLSRPLSRTPESQPPYMTESQPPYMTESQPPYMTEWLLLPRTNTVLTEWPHRWIVLGDGTTRHPSRHNCFDGVNILAQASADIFLCFSGMRLKCRSSDLLLIYCRKQWMSAAAGTSLTALSHCIVK